MATILDRYGIKEVADVTFYEIDDETGVELPGKPVLYLDTLKVSTIEQTAESADARGGKGNAALISWDYGKEITVTLEDALYSAKSLALMFGDVDANGLPDPGQGEIKSIKKTLAIANVEKIENGNAVAKINGADVTLHNSIFYKDGKELETKPTTVTGFDFVTGNLGVTAITIDVSANSFPGTYYVTGDTYARSETTGKDEFFQFIIPKAKVLSESNTITLEAEGDPTVFSMSLKVLRPKNGKMMQLVQYSLTGNAPVEGEEEEQEPVAPEGGENT